MWILHWLINANSLIHCECGDGVFMNFTCQGSFLQFKSLPEWLCGQPSLFFIQARRPGLYKVQGPLRSSEQL